MKQGYRRVLAAIIMAVMLLTGCGGPSDAAYTQVNAQ